MDIAPTSQTWDRFYECLDSMYNRALLKNKLLRVVRLGVRAISLVSCFVQIVEKLVTLGEIVKGQCCLKWWKLQLLVKIRNPVPCAVLHCINYHSIEELQG